MMRQVFLFPLPPLFFFPFVVVFVSEGEENYFSVLPSPPPLEKLLLRRQHAELVGKGKIWASGNAIFKGKLLVKSKCFVYP